jgi:hypothetical protein
VAFRRAQTLTKDPICLQYYRKIYIAPSDPGNGHNLNSPLLPYHWSSICSFVVLWSHCQGLDWSGHYSISGITLVQLGCCSTHLGPTRRGRSLHDQELRAFCIPLDISSHIVIFLHKLMVAAALKVWKLTFLQESSTPFSNWEHGWIYSWLYY